MCYFFKECDSRDKGMRGMTSEGGEGKNQDSVGHPGVVSRTYLSKSYMWTAS